MDSKIPQHIIDTLIVLGSMEDAEVDRLSEKFEVLRPYENLNRLHWKDWYAVCEALDVESHIALLKTLTLAERYGGWGCGGSVSAAIWVYRNLEEKVPYQTAVGIAHWIIAHSENEYLPFGGPGKRSLFLKWESNDSGNKNGSLITELIMEETAIKFQNDQAQKAMNERSRAERLQREKMSYDQHQARRQQSDDARRIVLEKAEGLDALGRLRLIVDYPNLPIDSFPTEWAVVDEDILSNLDKSLCKQLIARIGRKNRGPWRNLCSQLTSISNAR
jgi:hypothetical protein